MPAWLQWRVSRKTTPFLLRIAQIWLPIMILTLLFLGRKNNVKKLAKLHVGGGIVGKKRKKVTETKTHAKKEHRGINSKFASKKHGISSKNMFDHPLSLQGVYSSILTLLSGCTNTISDHLRPSSQSNTAQYGLVQPSTAHHNDSLINDSLWYDITVHVLWYTAKN